MSEERTPYISRDWHAAALAALNENVALRTQLADVDRQGVLAELAALRAEVRRPAGPEATIMETVTRGDVLLNLAQAFLPEGDPQRVFVEWLHANASRLREATVELGIAPPEPGPHFAKRLEAAVMPVLLAKQANERARAGQVTSEVTP